MAAQPIDRCPICKHAVEKDALMCPLCGYSLLTVCKGCNTPTQIQYSYCPHCSRPLKTDEVVPTYQELQAGHDKNRSQLIEYARDLSRLFVKQRQLEQYLPTGLLDKVLLSDTQVVGERRYLTVLFTDVVGFTELSAGLDPEEVFLLMNNCFALLVEQVYKFGGSVDKFIGDALMALFGAPISYGNDAERAVRAAVGMQAAMAEFNRQMLPKLGKSLELRIGISTGDAIAGTVGVEGQWSYTVMGATVNLASRLQSAAGIGGILVNEDVYRQTKDLINYRILPPVPLKGIGEAVSVFEVTGKVSETASFQQLPLGQLSAFVGRQDELAQLNQMAARLGDGLGQVAFVTGETGLGKTRLLWEWQARLSPEVQVWPGFAQNLSQTGYQVWQEIILQGLSLHKASHQTIVSVLLEYLGDETWLPFLEVLLFGEMLAQGSLGSLEPGQLKEQIFVAVNRLLSKVAQRGPLVIILDNLQWIDPLSAELLQSLLTLGTGLPVIFCLGSRPEAKHLPAIVSAAEALFGPRVVNIALAPLAPAESQTLLEQRLPVEDMPEKLRRYILEHAQNNPYYLEELISFIIHSGFGENVNGRWRITNLEALGKLSLPGTLRGLVRAQIDRLPEAQQQILSYGAVLGPTFAAALLLNVLDRVPHLTGVSEHLTQLVKQGILTFDGASYHFVHNSVYETAYQSLLSERRRQMHQQAGEAIEARTGATIAADVEQLAYHFAAADNAPKAVPYLIEAGEKAKQRFANQTALDFFSTALKMLPRALEFAHRQADIYSALGSLHQLKGDYEQALEYYRQGVSTAQDANQQADFYRLTGQIWQSKGDTAAAQQWLEEALGEIARSHDQINDLTRGRIYASMGLFNMQKGDYVRAERWSLDAVAALEQINELSDLARSLNTLGGVYYFQNRWAEASANVERALEIRRQTGDLLGLAGSLSNLGILYSIDCQWDKAIDVFNQSIAMCREIGALEATLGNALNNVAYLYLHQGRLDLAEAHLQESLTIKRKAGTTLEVPATLNNLALNSLIGGNLSAAEAYIAESIAICRENDEQDSLSEAQWYLAEIKLAAGEIEAAQEACRQAVLLANQVGSKVNEGGALRALARVHLRRQEYKQARQTANISLRLLKKINLGYEAARTQILLAQIAKLEGDEETCRQIAAEARTALEKLNAVPELKLLQELPHLQPIS